MLPVVNVQMNRRGGLYCSGGKLPTMYRERVLDLHHANFAPNQIADLTRRSRHFVRNVLRDYNITNSSLRPPRAPNPRIKMTPDVVEYIEHEKLIKPSTYVTEIQDRLLLDGIVYPADIPSKSAIKKCIRSDLMMSYKKLTVTPIESTTENVIHRTNVYLDEISDLNPASIHFFDESSVVKTTGNRLYGSSYIGEPAVEIQRYASNATFTINLLHSMKGVDFMNTLNGPSNGNEMILFFEQAVELERNGTVILERGDRIIMDNCGFHHGHFAENTLREMLDDYGLRLVFQPPYSPHLNSCDLCFNQIKCYLKRNQLLAEHQTEIAIYNACIEITPDVSAAYFRHIGYL